MKRRELFSSLASSFFNETKEESKSSIIRPPYYSDKKDFYESCSKCDGKCSEVCESNIIRISKDHTPFIDFSNNGCTYCDECAKACDYEVLKIDNKKNIDVKISIDILKCLSWNKTMCFSCQEPCLDSAIDFTGMFRPEIDLEECTSCGFCIKSCPTSAINIEFIKNGANDEMLA